MKDIETRYKESLDFLFSQLPMFSRIGAPAYKPGLDTSIKLSRYFGDPQNKFKSIHIGGTNGKGSTSHMIASILQSQGYKTGLYTSPHLVDFRERMRINGEMIPKEKVIRFVDNWKKSGFEGHPSFFELTMIMAFEWFAEEKIDYAVIEVGMGGRLDSTNIISPEISVITNISKDHTQFLGDTLEKIAFEKSGIIKERIPVVIGEKSSDSIAALFKEKAKQNNSPIIFAEDYFEKNYKIERISGGWKVNYKDWDIRIPLEGDYQKNNIRTVLTSIDTLKNKGIKIQNDSIMKGLENVVIQTGLKGRWMKIKQEPLVIADTGHNTGGLKFTIKQLKELTKSGNKLRFVIGFVADKEIDEILGLLPHDAIYYVTNAKIPRALAADELKKKFDKNGFISTKFDSVEIAYKEALNESKADDIVFVGGSTFIVADLLSNLNNQIFS